MRPGLGIGTQVVRAQPPALRWRGCFAGISSSRLLPVFLTAVSVFGGFPVARSTSIGAQMGVVNKLGVDVSRKFRSAQVVCFDVDSTVLTVEGIDELADVCGVKDEVQNLTSGTHTSGNTANLYTSLNESFCM